MTWGLFLGYLLLQSYYQENTFFIIYITFLYGQNLGRNLKHATGAILC